MKMEGPKSLIYEKGTILFNKIGVKRKIWIK